MLISHTNLRQMVVLGALCLLAAPGSSQAEPSPLDEGGSPPAAQKPDTEQPKQKKAITVPAGTVMMIKTGEAVSSNDKAGRKFSATLQANLVAGDELVAKAGSQVYGQVMKSADVGRGIVMNTSSLVLNLTQINVDGTLYPIQTGSFSERSTGVVLQRRAVVVPAGSILEFSLTQPLTVGK